MIDVKKEGITKEVVDQWYSEWEVLREQIHVAHNARNGEAKDLMERGIVNFLNFVVGASDIDEYDATADYEVLPINGKERIAFIQAKPGQYACYRQLDELYKETKKRCARLRLKS
ncbi:YpoC family protein [Solibacillus sp. CAU 1738]|uniref:YpoC family protein n=1 Tax=Solibacillus sp. CAU 1738 TaxID=3140363 RepID=UPI003261B04D